MGTASFSGNISQWNTSSVQDMNHMFGYATHFNSNISNWDMSSVSDMSTMLKAAKSFDGDISNCDVSRVAMVVFSLHEYGFV